MKDYKSNKKYFTQRSPVPFHVAYVAVCFVSIVLFFISTWLWPLAFLLFFVGSLIEVGVCQRYVSDRYFESFLPSEKETFAREFEERYQPIDPRTYHRNATLSPSLAEKHERPSYGGEYRYLPSDFHRLGVPMEIRIGLDTVVRSSVYCLSGLQVDPDRVCLMTKRIAMTEDLSAVDYIAIPYRKLSRVSMESTPIPFENRAAHCIELVFYGTDESVMFRLPVHGGYDSEKQVERLNELIEKSHEEAL